MNFKKLITFCLIACLPVGTVLAQELDAESDNIVEETDEINEGNSDDVLVEEKLEEENEEELRLLNEKFLEAKEEVSDTQDDLRRSISETSYLESRLEEIDEDIVELEDLIDSIDRKIEILNDDIRDTEDRLDDIEDTLDATRENLSKLDVEISYNIDQLLFMMELLFYETDEAGFFDNDELQTIKLLLAEDDVDEILEDVENVSAVENYMQLTLEQLERDKEELNDLFDKFEELKATKLALRERQRKQKATLQIESIAKNNLLEATRGEQQIYENLIAKAKTEQAVLRQEIVSQISKYREFRDLIAEVSGEENLDDDATFLSWPVEPTRGLSATFMDSSYQAALGIAHYAIDVPVNAGTSVMSAAPGVVFKVKGGEGNDYHYILIGHSDGLMTLYGHMYDIFVEEGDAVARGDIIGLSGGTPGTRGAGYLTTGAHLHFETIKDGVNVDPLPFLDPSKLP